MRSLYDACKVAYAALGDAHRAMAWLEQGVEERAVGLGAIDVSPLCDPLRADARGSRRCSRAFAFRMRIS